MKLITLCQLYSCFSIPLKDWLIFSLMPVRAKVAASVMTNWNISYTNAAQGAKESTATDAVSGLFANDSTSV